MGSAFLCGTILFKPRPFHPISELLGLFSIPCTPHKRTPVTQMVNPNFHQTNKKTHASGNAPIKGRLNLWTYWADESCPRISYNTLLLTVPFVPRFQSALNILEDLGPL